MEGAGELEKRDFDLSPKKAPSCAIPHVTSSVSLVDCGNKDSESVSMSPCIEQREDSGHVVRAYPYLILNDWSQLLLYAYL